MRCEMEGCGHAARFAPMIGVPAQGWPIAAERHMSMILGLAVCREHFLELQPEDFLDDKLRQVFEIMARGKIPPDFDRAFVRKVALDSPEYLALVKRKAEQSK